MIIGRLNDWSNNNRLQPSILIAVTIYVIFVVTVEARPQVVDAWQRARILGRPLYYVVQKKDTIYRIAATFHLDYRQLALLNQLSPPYRLREQQRLLLAGVRQPVSASAKKQQATSLPGRGLNFAQALKPQSPKPNFLPKIGSQSANRSLVARQRRAVKAQPAQYTSQKMQAPAATISYQSLQLQHAKWRWPTKGKIISSFIANHKLHQGLDIASRLGAPVYAVQDGQVMYSGQGLRNYERLIIIKHSAALLTAYNYLHTMLVREGMTIKYGQKIATVGKNSIGRPMLHFEIRKWGKPVDPKAYLKR